ncbi:MAG: RodZ domain-containing protein [Acidiferrobacterales bacterium]
MPRKNRSRPTVGPGEFLSDTRCKLGLEPDNVAQILHLSRHQIEAIEANDYESLPEPTYVRGYLRSYCQLLNISPDSVIDSYNEAAGGWKTTTYSGLTAERQIGSNDNIVRFVTLGVIGVVFGLAFVWWLGEDDAPEVVPAPTEVAATPSNGIGDRTDVAVEELPQLEQSQTSAVPTETAPVETPEPEPVESVVEVKPEQIPQPAPEQGENTAQPTRKEVATSLPKSNPTIISGARVKLVMRTEGDSWADIRDANGNKLLYETVAAGRVITIEGETPLHVFLGNASVVSLEINGSAYNFSQFRRGLTARFSVGDLAESGSE